MPVASANVTATGTLVSVPATVVGLYYAAGASAGSVVLRDNGAGGTVKLTLQTPASAGFGAFVPIGGGGLQFNTDVHATLTNAVGVTVIYQ